MVFSRSLFALLGLLTLAPLGHAAAKAKPTRPEVDNTNAFKGAIVIDAATGGVLIEDRADYSGPPASMTKLMTFAVLQDKLDNGSIKLDTPVRIMPEDNIGGTQVFLDPRETFPVEELMYAMMIQSANDAARALARFSGGSVESFIALMNAKAKELGMTRTTFRSPHGLPPTGRRLEDSDITTPRDYALLCRHLLLNTTVLKYSSVKRRDFGTERKEPMKMDNHNHLLSEAKGIDGLKTGFTNAAGYCTSITAQRKDRRLIVVVMGSKGPGGTNDLGKVRDIKAMELLERGFGLIPATNPPFVAKRAPEIPVINPAKMDAAKAAKAAAEAAKPEPMIKVNIPKK